MYIRFHQRVSRLGQSRSRLLTRHWPLSLVHVRAEHTTCGCGRRRTGTLPIEEQSGSEDRDCCYATDDAAGYGPRA